MVPNEDKQKIGSGHAAAMARLGLKELRNAVFPNSNVAQHSGEYGVYGNLTPSEVSQSREDVGEPPKSNVQQPERSVAEREDDREIERD